MTGTRFGLAPLSLLGVEPAELVRIAATAGFDFVGLRVVPVTHQEPDLNLLPGSARLTEVREALAQTGLPVVDIEFLALDGRVTRENWLPVLESGGALGASSVTAAGCDTDRERLSDTLAELAQDCREHRLWLNLEPISYQPVHSIPEAAALARQSRCCWLPDTLHISRFGGTAQELGDHTASVTMLQVCDGNWPAPETRDGLIEESRSKRLVPGTGDFELVSMIRALAPGTDLSVEVPDPVRRKAVGDLQWARTLLAALGAVAEQAAADVG